MQSKGLVCGIDFGTSNSGITVFDGHEIFVPEIGQNTKNMPTLLFFDEAHNEYVGTNALHAYLLNKGKGRLIQSFKTFLSDSTFTGTQIGTQRYLLEDFVAAVVRVLRAKAETVVGSQSLSRAVIGRPARFSDDSRKDALAEERLIKAVQKAGFNEIAVQYEPIAAAFDYEFSLEKEELVLVGDFGGGTSDFTLMRLSPDRRAIGDRSEDIIGTGGVTVAGDAFNSRIMWNKLTYRFGRESTYETLSGKTMEVPTALLWHLCEWHKLPFLNNPQDRGLINQLLRTGSDKEAIQRFKDVLDYHLGFNLFLAIDAAKCSLSQQNPADIHISNDYFEIWDNLSVEELEEFTQREIHRIEECITQLLEETGVSSDDIDSVFLTGGSSNLSLIRDVLVRKFGINKIRREGAGFINVARGLALSAPHLQWNA